MDLEKQKEQEEDFNLWLSSIVFVDEKGNPLPMKLEEDDSDDPEGDRS